MCGQGMGKRWFRYGCFLEMTGFLFAFPGPANATFCDLLHNLFHNQFCRCKFHFCAHDPFPNNDQTASAYRAGICFRNDVFFDFRYQSGRHFRTYARLSCFARIGENGYLFCSRFSSPTNSCAVSNKAS